MPGEVEDKLKEVFRLAQDWGCIMLLDEADVFLAQRTVTDHQRNALVSGNYIPLPPINKWASSIVSTANASSFPADS